MAKLGSSPEDALVLRLEQRKSFALRTVFRQADGRDVDLTGCAVTLDWLHDLSKLRRPEQVTAADVTTVAADLADAARGVAVLNVQAADLALAPGGYPFSLTLRTADGYSVVVAKGELQVQPNPELASAGEVFAAGGTLQELAIALRGAAVLRVTVGAIVPPGKDWISHEDQAKLDLLQMVDGGVEVDLTGYTPLATLAETAAEVRGELAAGDAAVLAEAKAYADAADAVLDSALSDYIYDEVDFALAYTDDAVAHTRSRSLNEVTDLDSLVEDGLWHVDDYETSAHILNLPVPAIPKGGQRGAGSVRQAALGMLQVRASGTRVHQQYTAMISSGHGRIVVYHRYRSGGGAWQPWTWGGGGGAHQAYGGAQHRALGHLLGAADTLPVTVRRTDNYPMVTVTTLNGDTWQLENGGFTTSASWDFFPLNTDLWQTYGGGWRSPHMLKTVNGIIGLRGLVKLGTYNTLIGTLPLGYRPPFRMVFSVGGAYNTDCACRVDVYPDGRVVLAAVGQAGATGPVPYLSLSGIMFPSNEVAPPEAWTALEMQNDFVDFSLISPSGGWPRVSYWEDHLGRAWLAGIGTRTLLPATSLEYARLPAKFAVARPLHLQAFSGAGFSTQDYGVGGTQLRWKTGGTNDISYFTLPTAPIVPDTLAADMWWRGDALLNGWANYHANYPPGGAYYAPDGLVHHRGLITSGTPGLPIADLDAGYRSDPAQNDIFVVNAYGAPGRVDVGGNRLHAGAGSNTWRSMDGIVYLREA